MNNQRLSSLDLLRSAAVLAVLFYHLPSLPSQYGLKTIAGFGALGVDLFFVLSGYLIAHQWFGALQKNPQPSLLLFFLRRGLRIWPNYFAILTLLYVVNLPQAEIFKPIWHFLLLVQNFFSPEAFPVSWSLCIEEHFYIFFPLLSLYLFRRKSAVTTNIVFVTLLVGGIFLRAALWFTHRPDLLALSSPASAESTFYRYFYFPTYSRLDGLTLGVGLASLKHFKKGVWSQLESRGNLLLFGSILLAFFGIAMTSHKLATLLPSVFSPDGAPVNYGLISLSLGVLVWNISFALLLAAALSPNSFLSRIKIPGAYRLALLSYSLYLVHVDAFKIGAFFSSRLNLPAIGWGATVIDVTCALVASAALYLAIERPFLILRERFN